MRRLPILGIIACIVVITLFLIPTYSIAAKKVYETVGTITGTDSNVYDFPAVKQNPQTCVVTLTDLNETTSSGFFYLFWTISTSTEVYYNIIGPGSITFDTSPGESFFTTVIGTGGGDSETGIYGIRIECWIK
jgi:hypothetical protein